MQHHHHQQHQQQQRGRSRDAAYTPAWQQSGFVYCILDAYVTILSAWIQVYRRQLRSRRQILPVTIPADNLCMAWMDARASFAWICTIHQHLLTKDAVKTTCGNSTSLCRSRSNRMQQQHLHVVTRRYSQEPHVTIFIAIVYRVIKTLNYTCEPLIKLDHIIGLPLTPHGAQFLMTSKMTIWGHVIFQQLRIVSSIHVDRN